MTQSRPKKERLDVILVHRGLAESRAKAQALILAGEVVVGDQRADKPGVQVTQDVPIRLKGDGMPYVSRGGLKLKAALDCFDLSVKGAVCADIGASTGGFTDCLLQQGALRVYAVDVGYGQLHQKLRSDGRVISRERVNARYLTAEVLPEPVQVAVVDVSFISLKHVLPELSKHLAPAGLLVALVKPQFEVGRENVGKGGVVKDAVARANVIAEMVRFTEALGFSILGTLDSPVPGPAGNVEALLAARKRV